MTFNQIETNLALLGADSFDLTIIHWPPTGHSCDNISACAGAQEQWAALEGALRAGKTRAIGVSNLYTSSCFECIQRTAKVAPMVNQVEYHVGMGGDYQGVRTYCDARRIVLQAYAPLGYGKVDTNKMLANPVVMATAHRHGKSPAQVFLNPSPRAYP